MVICGILCVVLTVSMVLVRKKPIWQKIRSPCLVLIAFGAMGFLSALSERTTNDTIASGKLERKAPGDGELETEACFYLPEEETEYPVTLTIGERKYKKAEETELISAAVEEIRETFCGENTSLQNIISNPVVSESYQNGAVTAEWMFSETGLISTEGEIADETLSSDGRNVTASVTLQCGESEELYEFSFRIMPKPKSKKENLIAEVEQAIAKQEETERYVELPEKVNGQNIEWRKAASDQSLEILGLGVLAAIAAAYAAKEQQEKKFQERKRKLLLSYPEFVSKLALLLGAGMNISGALRKMNAMYQKKKKTGKEEIVYEELYRMICEMDNGKGELRAYQAFAEQCDLQPYRKLVSLLSSGQRVGSRRLTEQLNEEADRVFAERKNAARRLGEEAGTKMLLPMLMMLVIVMGIIMVPAFLSIYKK